MWSILWDRQAAFLPENATNNFIEGIDKVGFVRDKIPNFDEVEARLAKLTAWSLTVVPGHIENRLFFEHIANKRFPATTWIRKMSELDYLEEPDMFHDVYGHIPLLSDQKFCDFLEGISRIALKHIDNDLAIELITRIYWYTVEFGLGIEADKLKIYGAGILSSNGESKFSLSNQPMKAFYNIQEIFHTQYIKEQYQDKYYVIHSFKELYDSLPEIESLLEKELDLVKTYDFYKLQSTTD